MGKIMNEFVKSMKKLMGDECAGPGLEEAVLLAFIGIGVSTAADSLGTVITKGFDSSTDALKKVLNITE